MRVTEIAVRRPITTAMVALIVVLLGGIGFLRVPIDLVPDVTLPIVTIRTDYKNVSPADIETLLTEPIERAITRVSGVENITAVSSEGRSLIRAFFSWGTNLDEAVSDVRSRIDRIRDSLPQDADSPVIFKFDVNAHPIIYLGVSGKMEPVELRRFAEDTIQYRLERIDGVASADLRGGLEREIHVDLFADKIKALDLSTEDVVRALRAENQNFPAGNVYQGNYRVVVRTLGEFQNLDQIRETLIARRNGRAIYLRDLASVEDSFQEIDHVIRINGRLGILMAIVKRPGENTVEVADQVKKELERINEDYKDKGIFASPLIDTSRYIRKSISQVGKVAAYGGILAIVILLIFLRNIRSTLVIATAIPISVIATFALIYFEGFTLNIMSFGGLALGIGLLVDNAIVVLENIFRHREAGADRQKAALVGTRQVSSAITAATLTTLVVFLPIIFIPGTAGVMFKQLALVVFFALATSLLVALTVIPVLSSKYLRISSERPKGVLSRLNSVAEHFFQAMDRGYQSLINWALGHRALVILTAALIFIASLYLYPMVGQEFMPNTDEGEVRIYAKMAEGTRIEVMDKAFTRLEAIVGNNVSEIQNTFTRFGNYRFSRNTPHRGDIRMKLVPISERNRSTQEIAQSLRRQVRNIPGLTARTRASGQIWIIRRVGLSDDDRLQINILGHDLERSKQIARRVKAVIETIPGVTDARISQDEGTPEAVLKIDRRKAANLGISISEIAQLVGTSLRGTKATLYREKGDEVDVVVRLRRSDREEISSIFSLPVKTPSGKTIPIGSVVSLRERRGPVEINRLDQERVITVAGDTYGRDMESIVADAREKLKEIPLPPDFNIQIGGDYVEKQRAFKELKWGLMLALILVYMVMAAQFESFIDPLIIMFSVPFGAVGVLLVLVLTGTTLNVNSFIGITMLVGIVVNNAIVLVDYVNLKVREDGLSVREAVIHGGRTRLRPILMTTFTTVLAMAPMALGLGEGGEVQAPLARVVIGGLTISTLISLVLIPVLYATVKQRQPVEAGQWMLSRWRLANGRIFRK